MAEGAPSKPIYMFYHIQNEKGESSAHPNACKIRCNTPGNVTLGDVLSSFPLTDTSSFHFRFQTTVDKQIVFVDMINPQDVVPLVNGNIICKILRLDNIKCATKNSYGLRLKQAPSRPVASVTGTKPAVSARGTAAPPPATAASSSPSVASPPVSPPIPMLKPVKQVADIGQVVVPDVVDADLADKSDYVKAEVMKRRQALAEEQARRIAEVAEREASQKKDQEDREKYRQTYGPRLKEWAEEPSGTKKNIRLLVSTLQNALWPESGWEPVPMAKLIEPKRVHLQYLKALRIVHPDKQNTMEPSQKYIAEQVFHYLETAFRVFQEAEMS